MEFENILLSKSERFCLLSMRLFGPKPSKKIKNLDHLTRLKLIAPCYSGKRDSIGQFIPTGEYSITNTYRQYCLYVRRSRMRSVVTPVIVSFITAILTTIVTELLKTLWLPELLNWLQGAP